MTAQQRLLRAWPPAGARGPGMPGQPSGVGERAAQQELDLGVGAAQLGPDPRHRPLIAWRRGCFSPPLTAWRWPWPARGSRPLRAQEPGSGLQARPETLDAFGRSARLGASPSWLATRALRRNRPGGRVRWQQLGADRDHAADRAVGQGQPLDLNPGRAGRAGRAGSPGRPGRRRLVPLRRSGPVRRGGSGGDTTRGRRPWCGTECLHDRHVRRIGDIQCRYVHIPRGPRSRTCSHCTTSSLHHGTASPG